MNHRFEFSGEEVKLLVNGKFQTRKCTVCDGLGHVFVTEDGHVVSKPSEDTVEDDCEDCSNLGFNLIFLD